MMNAAAAHPQITTSSRPPSRKSCRKAIDNAFPSSTRRSKQLPRPPSKIMMILLLLLMTVVLATTSSCAVDAFQTTRIPAFVQAKTTGRRRQSSFMCCPTTTMMLPRRSSSQKALQMASSTTSNDDNNSRYPSSTLVIMDWECLLDSREYHVKIGIQAALQVWPHLSQLVDTTDDQWLRNKLHAISAVLVQPCDDQNNHYHVACEYALATRLILEEQALDGNASTGKQGKYAKRYHPRQEIRAIGNNSNDDDTPSTNTQTTTGTRPLTVGEIQANWRDSLRETLLVKYHVYYQPPLPILEQAVCDIIERLQSDNNTIPLYPHCKFALQNSALPTMVRVRHEADIPIVQRSLRKAGIDFWVTDATQQALLLENANNNGATTRTAPPPLTVVVVPTNDYEGNGDMVSSCMSDHDFLRQTLQQVSQKRNAHVHVHYCDASYYRLEPLTALFGDHIPRSNNRAKCGAIVENDNTTLSLWLCEWTTTTEVVSTATTRNSQVEQAMVYPWTDVLSANAFVDLLLQLRSCSASATAFQ